MEARGSRFLGADGGVSRRGGFDSIQRRGKDHVVVFKQLLRTEEKNAHTFTQRDTYTFAKEQFVIGKNGRKEGLFSALRNSRAFVPRDKCWDLVCLVRHCFISKALFRGHSETRNGTKEKKKKDTIVTKRSHSPSVFYPLLWLPPSNLSLSLSLSLSFSLSLYLSILSIFLC